MKNLLLVLLTLTAFSTGAQTSVYHPFPESDACWNINMSQGMCFMGGFSSEDYSLTISGDTTINSQTYHKLTTPYVLVSISGGCTQQNFAGYQGAIRQDIAGRKVYFVPPTLATEYLLYDFTMEIGDTVKGYLEAFNWPADTVVGTDSVLIGADYRKRWLINPCYDIYLIEGIGSTFGLLKPSPGCATDMDFYALSCFSQDGQTLYPESSAACQLITSTQNIELTTHAVHIFPNPSNGSFNIGFDKPEAIKELRLTDMTGKIILQKQLNNHSEVSIDRLPAGTYLLTIVDRENSLSTMKIVSKL